MSLREKLFKMDQSKLIFVKKKMNLIGVSGISFIDYAQSQAIGNANMCLSQS
jgi:hypothetical protein